MSGSETKPLVFFIHIMKTGGLVLNRFVRRWIPEEYIYPRPVDRGALAPYFRIDDLRALSDHEKARFRYVTGHFPYCAGELFDRELTRIAFFREPVARVISHLRMIKDSPEFAGHSLTQIYDDDRFRRRHLLNLQCRCFAHELTDELKAVFRPLDLSADDIERAKQRVLQCAVIGLQEDYERSFATVAETLRMPFEVVPRGNSSTHHEVPGPLRARIAEDNAADIEFYDFVRREYERRYSAGERRCA